MHINQAIDLVQMHNGPESVLTWSARDNGDGTMYLNVQHPSGLGVDGNLPVESEDWSTDRLLDCLSDAAQMIQDSLPFVPLLEAAAAQALREAQAGLN